QMSDVNPEHVAEPSGCLRHHRRLSRRVRTDDCNHQAPGRQLLGVAPPVNETPPCRQGDKETRRQGEVWFSPFRVLLVSLSPCLLVSLSPCLLVEPNGQAESPQPGRRLPKRLQTFGKQGQRDMGQPALEHGPPARL